MKTQGYIPPDDESHTSVFIITMANTLWLTCALTRIHLATTYQLLAF